MSSEIRLEDRNKTNYGTPVNVQDPNWQLMVTAPASAKTWFQIIGQWKYGYTSPVINASTVEVEVRGPNGFIVQKFQNDMQIHEVPPGHSAWLRIADKPGNYGDNDLYGPDPLRFIVGDAP